MKRTSIVLVAIAVLSSACGTDTDARSAVTSPGSSTTASSSTTTEVPTSTVPGTETTTTLNTTSDADKTEISALYEIVFSSETGYDEKAPLIDDPAGLEATVAKYQETGASMGGVGLEATAISVDGEVAAVTYDLLFGGTPTYPNLSGDAVLLDGTWKVTREMFCSIMDSARVGCPAS